MLRVSPQCNHDIPLTYPSDIPLMSIQYVDGDDVIDHITLLVKFVMMLLTLSTNKDLEPSGDCKKDPFE